MKRTPLSTFKKPAAICALSLTGLMLETATANADTHTIQAGESFYSIASQYGMDAYDLAAMNNLTINSLILPGQQLTVASTTSTVTTTSTTTTTTSQGYEVEVDANGQVTNPYPVGQCTWGVKSLAPWVGDWWGNGGDWSASAATQGYRVGTIPTVGGVICWTDGGYGHVAYVTAVDYTSGQIQVLEANYNNQQQINNYRGWFNPTASTTAGQVSYIYPY